MTAKEMSGFFCAVTPQPETFNVTFCASPFWGRPRLHGQNSSGSCASKHCEIALECGSVRHGSGCAVSIKSLIVAANNSNGSTLNESYCLFAPFEMYLPQMVEEKAYSWHCAASASRIWLRPLSNSMYTVTGSAWDRSTVALALAMAPINSRSR
jgi:hypothetical protein